jgi:colanic acid biosynthesis glycosyl transferase WcaI
MLKENGPMTRILYGLESLGYASATRVSSISPGILRMLRRKKVAEGKLLFFPNGVCLGERLRSTGAFRRRHEIAEETFVILYSGNLGVKQGLQGLIDTAHYLQERGSGAGRIQFVIAGAGAMRGALATQIERQKLSNVLLLPLQPEDVYREMMADADCCAITQQPGTGELFFPSKLLTTLALGKPVLAIADEESDLALAVVEGGFGVTVPPGSTAAVAEAAERLMGDRAALGKMGECGREYVARYEVGAVLEQFERDLKGVLDPAVSVAAPALAASSVAIDP